MLPLNPQSAGRSGNSVPSPQREFILLGSGILTRHGGSSADICFAAEGLITGLEVTANKLGKKAECEESPSLHAQLPDGSGGQEQEGMASRVVPLSAKISRTSAREGRLSRPRPKPRLLPQSVPPPSQAPNVTRQPVPQLVRQHQNLPAMMRLVGEHVREHRPSGRPNPSPTPARELCYAALGAARQSIRKHSQALRPTLLMRRRCLLHRATIRI